MTEHYLILNRWVDEYAQYEKYVDHATTVVTYITTFAGSRGVPAKAEGVRVVDATDDFHEVSRAADELCEQYGRPTHVIALYEDDTICGARLREKFGCPGPRPEELLRFRDKGMQADTMARAGIRAPRFRHVESVDDVAAFAEQVGYPVIVKPTRASSCKGIEVLTAPADVHGLQLDPEYRYLAQEFIDFPVYHVDGLYAHGELVRVGVNRYFNTCIAFQEGGHLGSLEVDSSPLRRAVVDFARQALGAMCTAQDSIVFHLELFVDHNAMPDQACTFLEVGARVGGGGIPFVWREIYNFDIMWMQFELSCGRPARSIPTAEPTGCAGWLLMQLPHQRPCKITSVTSLVGLEMGPYAEALPRRGQTVPLTDTFFEHVAGRFRFKGRDHLELFDKMVATSAAFRIEATPVTPALASTSAP